MGFGPKTCAPTCICAPQLVFTILSNPTVSHISSNSNQLSIVSVKIGVCISYISLIASSLQRCHFENFEELSLFRICVKFFFKNSNSNPNVASLGIFVFSLNINLYFLIINIFF